MLYFLLYEKLYQYVSPFRRLPLHDFSHGVRQPHGAVSVHRAGAVADRQAARVSNWPVYPRGRAEIASEKGRYADHGRGADHHFDRDSHAVVGGPAIRLCWIAIAALLGYGCIGFMDDYAKVTRRRNLGLTGRRKLVYQFCAGFVFAVILLVMRAYGDFSTAMNIPFLKQFKPSLMIQSLLRNHWTYALGAAPFCIFVALVVVFAPTR